MVYLTTNYTNYTNLIKNLGRKRPNGYEWAEFVKIRAFSRKIQFVPFVKFVVPFHQISVFD